MTKPLLNAKELIDKYTRGECTEEERSLVEHWYEQMQSPEFELPEAIAEVDLDVAWRKIQTSKDDGKSIRLWKWTGVAASLIIISAIAILLTTKNRPAPVQALTDVAPGGNYATLKLANGKIIRLVDHKDGEISKEAGVSITKTKDGQLVYAAEKQNQTGHVQYNTITTPMGGQYQVTLPDHSKVWLNAASSLTYATSLNERGERRVTLESGEAYFEISKDNAHPFVVTTNSQEVEVLGTHFNINAYADEQAIKTTLLEGSVRVRSTVKSATSKIASQQNAARNDVILKPGQQSVFTDKSIRITDADLEAATGWKDGFFVFNNTDVPSIMRQLSRWYAIDVSYSGEIPKDMFTGGISRQSNLSTVLKMLELIHIRYKLVQTDQRKTLIINP